MREWRNAIDPSLKLTLQKYNLIPRLSGYASYINLLRLAGKN